MIARKHLKKSLEALSYVVEAAASGAEGLKTIDSFCPECIILDQLMPEMEGSEVLQRMREAGCLTPVIVMTADTQNTTHKALIEAGASEVMSKPPIIDDLVKVINALTGK
jgi:DNA-binding response OmpR family regulator